MLYFFKRAVRDIRANRFLNFVAVITIALSVLIISAFVFFLVNANALIDSWTKGIRIMAYLEPGIPKDNITEIRRHIEKTEGVGKVRFISKTEAMDQFKKEMEHQSSLISNLKENPLPDTFEIAVRGFSRNWEKFESAARGIATIPGVEEVEYGRKWLGRFISIFNLFRLTGYAMTGLFFVATIFFVANTIRLMLYSRREEIEIMRLVGASESFVKDPFYIQSIILGAFGGLMGLGALFAAFRFIMGNWKLEMGNLKWEPMSDFQLSVSDFQINFLSPEISGAILLGSVLAGCLGCYISLRQFLKLY